MRAAQAIFDMCVKLGPAGHQAVDLRTVGDVSPDRHGEGIRFLGNPTEPAAMHWRVDVRVVDIGAIQFNAAGDDHVACAIMHPVEAFEGRRLAAAGWAYEREDFVGKQIETDSLERMCVAIPEIDVFQSHQWWLVGQAPWR